jgi:hypothetical protein
LAHIFPHANAADYGSRTDVFLRQAANVWSVEEHSAFIDFIARNPEVGDLIPQTGGLRKIRWRRQGMGKRGGVRVIHFYYDSGIPLYLLMVYAKARREDLSPDERRNLQTLLADLKRAHDR